MYQLAFVEVHTYNPLTGPTAFILGVLREGEVFPVMSHELARLMFEYPGGNGEFARAEWS
jgi:hypothetical protein